MNTMATAAINVRTSNKWQHQTVILLLITSLPIQPSTSQQLPEQPAAETTTPAAYDVPVSSATKVPKLPPILEEPPEEAKPSETEELTPTNDPPPAETTTPPVDEATTRRPIECIDTKYCFNGGKCILNDMGYPQCICIEGFYGNRCQTMDICKTVIVDSLTGDQICAKIDRSCFKHDKFFRCSCHQDEYFIFKNLQDANSNNNNSKSGADQAPRQPVDGQDRQSTPTSLKRSKSDRLVELLAQRPDSATFAYDLGNSNVGGFQQDNAKQKRENYLAECRKIDKCLGIRCRQLSEVCVEGACVCNQDAGYIADPTDSGICKLLDPCTMPAASSSPSEPPLCGQAKCVATFDRTLYRCVCPVGHVLIQIGQGKSSSICTPLNDAICDVPLLNKCQHLCHIDLVQNTYKCSCFRGYNSGKRPGIDGHMCFFDEHTNDSEDPNDPLSGLFASRESADDFGTGSTGRGGASSNVFRWYKIPQLGDPKFAANSSLAGDKFTYDTKPAPTDAEEEAEEARTGQLLSDSDAKSLRPDQYLIRREPVGGQPAGNAPDEPQEGASAARDSWDDSWDQSVAKMSAQERCNRMCGQNRICVLENASSDSYRCICDRQGYVSVGDKCLEWCAAAEFSHRIRILLYKYGCWTLVCKSVDKHPQLWSLPETGHSEQPEEASPPTADELAEREQERHFLRLSSWRPQFECDCSSSPFLRQDPQTRLCQLDFRATLEPCLPGNVGYIDCVENKNAYCAVLHRSSWSFIKDLIHDKYKMPSTGSGNDSASLNNKNRVNKQAQKLIKEKLYTCVCSPDKKFLVDKPRNKERCVDECNMLNIECVRFNRMCRSASIAPDDFGRNNLVRYDLDGAVKMNFRRTGCECLPGFNVGPTESVDFTLDDEEDYNGGKSTSLPAAGNDNSQQPKDPDGYPMPDIVDSDDILEQAEHMRAKYINIDSSCLLDYDVVEFHASFKSPAGFDPSWIRIRNPLPEAPHPKKEQKKNCSDNNNGTGCEANGDHPATSSTSRMHHQSSNETGFYCELDRGCQLQVPKFMQYNISDLHKNIVLVAQCEPALDMQSVEAYQECIRYRYWIIQKLRRHYVDWRRVITSHLSDTFDLMDGNIRLRVNKCESTLKSVSVTERNKKEEKEEAGQVDGEARTALAPRMVQSEYLDPMDPESVIDADIECELTLHSASDGSSPRYSRKVLLEKQLQRFIFVDQATSAMKESTDETNYYLMAPNMLIRRESFDQLAVHRKVFNPCESNFAYCDMQTDCHMVDTVNFTCTCKFGYTPIGSRDIYYGDSRKEVCEDIDECLFDVCKDLAGVADCENTIGDYKCLCRNQYTGDNKRYCNHVCNTINCHHLHGKCRIVAPHHALCECEDGYKEADCSVQDPNVALRKANMIIVGSIFTSVLLLMITLAISLNSQLKKTKKKLKRLEAISATANLFELHTPQPFRPRMSKAS